MNTKIEKIKSILMELPEDITDTILDALETFLELQDKNPKLNIGIDADYKIKETRSLSGGI